MARTGRCVMAYRYSGCYNGRMDGIGDAVKQLREDLKNKADVGSFDAQFQRLELTLGHLVELVWHLSEVIGTRLEAIEARLDAGGL